MKTEITISCRDKIFARMLELELTAAGYFVAPTSKISVVDYDEHSIKIIANGEILAVFERPFYVRELVELLDSQTKETVPIKPREPLNDIVINSTAKKVIFRGNEIPFTRKEYELFAYLYDKKGTPVSREEALRQVWKYDYTGDTNIVDVFINYLRTKIDNKYNVKIIYTVRNKGYMIK